MTLTQALAELGLATENRAISPEASCPMMIPGFAGKLPFIMCRSVPHTAANPVLISTSSGDILGLSYSNGELLALVAGGGLSWWGQDGVEHHREPLKGVQPSCMSVFHRQERLLLGEHSGAIQLWDLLERRKLRTLHGGLRAVNAVSGSEDGRWILSGGPTGAELWDLQTDGMPERLPGARKAVWVVNLSWDGSLASYSGLERGVRFYDVGRGTSRWGDGHRGSLFAAVFTARGDLLTSARSEPVLRWRQDGRSLGRVGPRDPLPERVHVSADERYLLCGGRDVIWWDLQYDRFVRRLARDRETVGALACSADNRLLAVVRGLRVTLWELETGVELRTLIGHRANVEAVAWSPDARWLFSGDHDGHLVQWDVASGRPMLRVEVAEKAVVALHVSADPLAVHIAIRSGRVLILEPGSGRLVENTQGGGNARAVALSRNGNWAVALGVDRVLRTWRLRQKETALKATMVGHSALVAAIATTPAGLGLAACQDGVLRIWDLHQVACVRQLPGHDGAILSLAGSADGRQIVTGGRDNTVRVWDLERGEQVGMLSGLPMHAEGVALSPDGGRVVISYGSVDVPGEVRDLTTGAVVQRLDRFSSKLEALTFTPAGGVVAGSGALGGQLAHWPADGGTPRLFSGSRQWIRRIVFAPDGGSLAVVAVDFSVKIRRWPSGEVRQELPMPRSAVYDAAFSPDGRHLLSAYDDGGVRLWSLAEGRVVREYSGHAAAVIGVAFGPTPAHALSTSRDGTMRLWNLDSGDSIALCAANDQWLAWTDDGLFDASREGGPLLGVVQGLRGYWADQLAAHYNRPDIMLHRLALGDPALIDHFTARHRRRLRLLELQEQSWGGVLADTIPEVEFSSVTLDGSEAEIHFQVRDPGGALLRYHVWDNGVPLLGVLGRSISGARQDVSLRVPMHSGPNRIEVGAMNRAGLESLRDVRVVHRPPSAPATLHYLGIGVSHYRDPSLNLGFAHKDVLDMAAVVRGMEGYFHRVRVKTLVNEQATRQAILAARSFFDDAAVDDVVILFIAGHGTWAGEGSAAYYFLGHDVDRLRIPSTALDFAQVEGLLDGIAPRRKLFLLDTCESGERDPGAGEFASAAQRGLSMRGARAFVLEPDPLVQGVSAPIPSRLLRQDRFIHNDLTRRTGAIVFSSSRGDEGSFERMDIQNGVFTEEIIRALTSGAADHDGDGLLTTAELRAWVTDAVSRATDGMQNPTVDRDNLDMEFKLPLVAMPRAVSTGPGSDPQPRLAADGAMPLVLSPDGRWLVGGSRQRLLRVWDAAGPDLLASLPGHEDEIRCLAVSPDGRLAASAGPQGSLHLWDLERRQHLRVFKQHEPVLAIAFAADGRFLCTTNMRGFILRWSVDGEQLQLILGSQAPPIRALVVTHDGRWLVGGLEDGSIQSWAVEDGKPGRSFPGHRASVTSLALSEDDGWLLSGGMDHHVKLWDFSGARLETSLEGHLEEVRAVAISADGRLGLSGGGSLVTRADFSLRLWNLKTGRQLEQFQGLTEPVDSVALTPAGDAVFAGSRDGVLRRWDVRVRSPSPGD